jgi:hypothetical protein
VVRRRRSIKLRPRLASFLHETDRFYFETCRFCEGADGPQGDSDRVDDETGGVVDGVDGVHEETGREHDEENRVHDEADRADGERDCVVWLAQ